VGYRPIRVTTSGALAGPMTTRPGPDEHPVYQRLWRLVDAWCDRRDLAPLATVLPAYLGNLG